MKKLTILILFVLMFVISANGQMMSVHYDQHDLNFNLENLDSLTFSDENFVQPDNITLSVDAEGIDAGGAVWSIEVSAMIVDENSNPVIDGMPVSFNVVEDIAMIENGYTGNLSVGGVSSQGVVNTLLHYHSINSNQEVTVNCFVMGAEGEIVSGSLVFNLPVQDANVQITTNRGNWFFGDDPAEFKVEAFVYDGHAHAINNEVVRFMATAGNFHVLRSLGSPANPEMLTGDSNEYPDIEAGWARRYLLVPFTAAFPDPVNLQTTVTMYAVLPNRGVTSDNVSLVITHPID